MCGGLPLLQLVGLEELHVQGGGLDIPEPQDDVDEQTVRQDLNEVFGQV